MAVAAARVSRSRTSDTFGETGPIAAGAVLAHGGGLARAKSACTPSVL